MTINSIIDLSHDKYLLVVKKQDDGRYLIEQNLDGTTVFKMFLNHDQAADLGAALVRET